jgi:multisubunit Na+/H+ antiporter MnhE subunit
MATATRHAAQTLVLFLLLAVFWVACVATFHVHEMIVGVPSVVLSVFSCLFVVRKLPIQFRPSLADLIQVWRLPWYIVSGLVEIALVLARDFAGHRAPSLFRSAPWRYVADNGEDVAKRTLAIGFTTVAPNFVIVGIDRKRRQMLFHQVQKSGVPVMAQRLGAGGSQ